MLIAVDAFITGTVDKFGSVIRIKIKAINPETGEVYASVFDNLPIDYDMSEFLGLDNWKENREKAEENKSQNPNCAKENVGDYCFFNNTNASYEIHLKSDLGGGFSSTYNKLIISPKMKACFKDLKMGSYSYEAKKKIGMVGPATKYSTEFKGDFTVKECESRLQNIENGSFKPNERIINSTNETELFSIEIINPNYYSRQLSFINSSNQTESVTVGSKSKTSIKLPKGFYRFLSNTTYTIVTVQQSNFTLKNNKSILLIEDHKN